MPSGFASINRRPNQSLEPTAGRCEVHFVFMKQSLVFATLAFPAVTQLYLVRRTPTALL